MKTANEILNKRLSTGTLTYEKAIIAMDEYAEEKSYPLIAEIERLKGEREWIPCSERLPEAEGNYLVYTKLSDIIQNIEICYFKRWWHVYSDEMGFMRNHRVTHWQHLPKPINK